MTSLSGDGVIGRSGDVSRVTSVCMDDVISVDGSHDVIGWGLRHWVGMMSLDDGVMSLGDGVTSVG